METGKQGLKYDHLEREGTLFSQWDTKAWLAVFIPPFCSWSRSQDSSTKMPWWHPGWTKHLSPRTVKTLKSNWLLRSCMTVCRTRQQTCWTNRTVWLTTSPTTVCTVKEPSRSWLPTTHPSHLLSRTSPRSFLPPPRVWTPLVCACNTVLHPVFWDQRLLRPFWEQKRKKQEERSKEQERLKPQAYFGNGEPPLRTMKILLAK